MINDFQYGLVHISTGDLLRAEVSSGTKIGVMVKKFMENGLLVPDDIVTDVSSVVTKVQLIFCFCRLRYP